MTTLLTNGKSRINSAEIIVENDQILTFILTRTGSGPFPPIVIQRKNAKNEFRTFSLNDGTFCVLDDDSTSVVIPIPGIYRVQRPSLDNFQASAGVTYLLENAIASDDPDQKLSVQRSSKDSNGLYKVLTYFRADGTKAKVSTLSGTSPEYDSRTETWFDRDGSTITYTTEYELSYDDDGVLLEENVGEFPLPSVTPTPSVTSTPTPTPPSTPSMTPTPPSTPSATPSASGG